MEEHRKRLTTWWSSVYLRDDSPFILPAADRRLIVPGHVCETNIHRLHSWAVWPGWALQHKFPRHCERKFSRLHIYKQANLHSNWWGDKKMFDQNLICTTTAAFCPRLRKGFAGSNYFRNMSNKNVYHGYQTIHGRLKIRNQCETKGMTDTPRTLYHRRRGAAMKNIEKCFNPVRQNIVEQSCSLLKCHFSQLCMFSRRNIVFESRKQT